ncbi:MAG TPA: NAD-dependent epimerase/dehydratase family protein [Gemmatimonadaceae bacterium]|nr:NAD-dependent epimerase/dehydratase family protein [Gemmatimonadaceae bacterium]
MIVAITGANGFIGRHLCERFAVAGSEARPVVRADYEHGRLAEKLRGADVIVHAAGATRAATRAGLVRSNVDLTAATLRAAEAAKVERFVFVSSQAAAGPASSRDVPVDEDDAPAPIETYGRAKLAAESRVRSSAIPWTIVRPAAVYGPRDRDFLALFRFASHGIAIHPGNREHWISIAHVTDVANGIFCAATSPAAESGTYFIANDEPVQWRGLFALAANAAGREIAADAEIPSAVVGLGAALGDVIAKIRGRAGLLTSEKVALSRAPFWICSNARARSELGFGPAVSLHDGLRETYVWYRQAGWL